MDNNAFISVRAENNHEIGRLESLSVPFDYLGMPWRGDPATGIVPGAGIFSADYRRLFTSKDGGCSWTSLPIDFEGFKNVGGFGALSDGTLLLLYSDTSSGMSFARSLDSGATWIPGPPVGRSPYTGMPGTDGNEFCQLPDGSIIVAVCLRNGNGITNSNGTDLPIEKQGIDDHVYHSKDGGQTWDERNILVKDSSESNFLSLGGTNVLAAIRRQRVDADDASQSWQQPGPEGKLINKVLFLANSTDGGRTWMNERPMTFIGGDCPGELVRLSDGRIIVLYTSRYPYAHGNITAQVSNDEGVTWSSERYIVSIGCGYSSSVVLDDDTIVSVCGNTQLNELTPDSRTNLGHNAEPWQTHSVRWKLPS